MAVAFRSFATNRFAWTAITKPVGLAVGDIMIAVLAFESGSSPVATGVPTGWTELYFPPTVDQVRGRFFAKKADAGDVAATTFNLASGTPVSSNRCAFIAAFSGAGEIADIVVGDAVTADWTANDITTGSVTTTRADALVLRLVIGHEIGELGAPTPPADATTFAHVFQGQDFAFQYSSAAGAYEAAPVTPGAAGTKVWTITGDEPRIALTIAVQAAMPAPVINSSLTADGQVDAAFSYSITATNSPTFYGATGLPDGLSVNTETGAITGTPTAAGESDVTISATNAGGSDSEPLVITIAAAPTAQRQTRTNIFRLLMEPQNVQLTYDWQTATVGVLATQHHCLFVGTGGTIQVKERAGGTTLSFVFADGTFFPIRLYEIVSLGAATGVLVGKMAEISGAQV